MNGGSAAKIRLIRCPKCLKVLVEPQDIPVYRCGGCNSYLRAKIRKSNPEVATSGLHETDADQKNTSETELARDRCSPEDLSHDALQTIPRTEPVVQVSEQINAQLENLSVGAGRTQVEEEEDVVNDSGRLVQPDAGGSSSGGLKRIPSMTRGSPFPVSSLKPVGQAFENNRNEIWSWLMDDEISTIGICGMGGIGKTKMLRHIYNELLRRPDISHHVYWVTLSRDFSIHNLQNLIAKRLDLDLSSEYDILPRAVKLSQELMKKQKWILILDDLWNSFELSAVGIPVPLKGCKLIMTTRSKAVCRQMSGRNNVRVNPLSRKEACTLFIEELGHDIALSPKVERIAVNIASQCAGFPLGIITLARSLRGVDDEHEWRNALNKLNELKYWDKVDDVSWMLRFSYDRLDDVSLQRCLLYCALFPEGHEIEREELIGYLILEGIIEKMLSREAAFHKGHEIEREELIGYLILEGIIEKMLSREAAFHKGHAMLDRLENAGFLQRIDGGRAVKMHDLARDMAIRICQENRSDKIKDVAIRIRKVNPSGKEQRRKGIEMAGSNIDPFWNHVEQMNDGGNSTHKTMVSSSNVRQRRKRIEMTPLKSGLTGAISAYAQEQNNVDMAQQREPLLTGEFERANDLTGAGIELPHDTPDNQDELKKLKGSKSRDMVDDFKSKLTGAVSASAREQNNVEMAQQQEPLLTGEFERANDLTAAGIERPRDTPDDQDDFKSGWTLLMTNLILEMASAVFDQLGYALVGMVLAFVALLLTPSPGKPAGTIVEYFGMVGGFWQCFYSTVEYAYARQKRDNPIKMCLLPFIFLLCVVISKLIKK